MNKYAAQSEVGSGPVHIPVFSGGQTIDRLMAAPASTPVRTPDGIQFTDSFGIHTAWTEREYKTPMTIEATVMTDSTNICLVYAKGKIILNWDRREDLLHVRHPATGQIFNIEGAGHVPVGRWHYVEWIIAEDVMRLLVDGEERFLLPGNYRGLSGKVGIHTGWRANLSVGSLEITERYPVAREGEEVPGVIVLQGYQAVPEALSSVGCLLGAMQTYNRYADRAALVGGLGIAFRVPALDGQDSFDMLEPSTIELARVFGLELIRWAGVNEVGGANGVVDGSGSGSGSGSGVVTAKADRSDSDPVGIASFIRGALAEGLPVFGQLAEGEGYAAITAISGVELTVESGGRRRRVSSSEAAGYAGVQMYAVGSLAPMSAREGVIQTFRHVADYFAEVGEVLYRAWLSDSRIDSPADSLPDAQQAKERSLAAIVASWCEARSVVVHYLEQQSEHVGDSCSGLLEEAIRLYQSTADSLAKLDLNQAVEAEREAARMLGVIAEKLAGKKQLAGLNVHYTSCISMFNTFMGVLKYYNIPCTESWMKGATGRAFQFAIQEQVNVHDICLPIPEERMIQLFANLGLEIDGIEGRAQGKAYQQLLHRAWDGTREAIDAGLASFGRSVEHSGGEYALLVGYDQDGYYTSGWHGRSATAIPWNMYGLGQCQCQPCTIRRNDWRTEGPVKTVCRCNSCQHIQRHGTYTTPQEEGEVRVYWSRPAEPADERTIVLDALEFAVEFAKPDGPWAKPGMRTAAEAYDTVIHALEKGKMDGWYLGLHANGWQELRYHAWQFLLEAKQRLTGDIDAADELDAAIAAAERLHRHFARLFEMFPWMQPFGPIPDTERRNAAAELLREAKKAEIAALAAYERLVERLQMFKGPL